jgi:hypothetical protein
MPAQPPDEWTYLRPEEFADDDAVEHADAVFETGAEDAALHMVDIDQPSVPNQGLDPGETLERPRADDGRTAQYFDDEEPESGPGRRTDNGDDATAEPRVDEILASQHYTFEPDGQ